MKNGKWQFVVGTSDFYLSLFICHLSFWAVYADEKNSSNSWQVFPNGGMISIGEIHRKFAWMAREFFFKN